MEVAGPLPTVAELVAYRQVPDAALAMAAKLAEPAQAVKSAVACLYTAVPIGIYLHGETTKAALFVPDETAARDFALIRAAVSRAADLPETGFAWSPTQKSGMVPEAEGYVKVAYSQTLRRTGELLNFFPGKYPGGIPNSPGPIQSMLTSGLLGAGLGYGAGWAAEQLLPASWQKKRLRHTLAAVGGGLGAIPGATWGLNNLATGRSFNDPAVLNHPAGAEPRLDPAELGLGKASKFAAFLDELPAATFSPMFTASLEAYAARFRADDAEWLKQANESFDPAEINPFQSRGPLSVNINALGETLWETGASPQTAAMTMGALAAARQMPGGGDDPGFVTPAQMGELAMHMGAGYLSGALVGAALGQLTGLPDSTQDLLKRTGMYTGLVRAIVPRLFRL